MELKNSYYRRSHISEKKLCQVLRYFAQDLAASDVAQLTGLTRKTVNSIFLKIRQRIAVYGNVEITGTALAKTDMPEELQEFIKRRMQKFKGVAPNTQQLHLKESEWRYRRRDQDLYEALLLLLREHPL